ncbi:MAG: antibiotic biosynthesis monooxygenase family protein [Bacteroidia bacterium]
MLTRLVKMNFKEESADEFIRIFSANKSFIAGFEGCHSVELKRDVNQPAIFFTISVWRSVDDLENYRKSELFKGVWTKTKILFAEKAEAWTLENADS